MVRVFSIEFPDDCGPLWMNVDNLMLCLTTENHCSNTVLSVTDVTGKGDCDSRTRTYNPPSTVEHKKAGKNKIRDKIAEIRHD